MFLIFRLMRTALFLALFSVPAAAQADAICGEFGFIPSLDAPRLNAPYVYGRVVVNGIDPASKLPKVSVILLDHQQASNRVTIGRSGYYCFRRTNTSGGTLIVEINGSEVGRKTLVSAGPPQQREDLEVYAPGSRSAPPSAISAKFAHPPNEKTVELYRKAADAERDKNISKVLDHLNAIVAADPADFIAWAKLGSVHFERKSLAEAEAAFRRSLELKQEFTPGWIYMGRIRTEQKQFEAAIEIFKHAAALEPRSARTFQLLGEAYLLTKQGTLGVQALNEAIRLDPVGMAECHLQLAHLYQLANAKHLASREYKLFLAKVPEHPDKKKFERYIKENPDKAGN